jgi:hypothetical protein
MIFRLRRHVGNHEGHEGHEDGGDKKAIADFGLTSASSVEPRILNRQARPPRRVNCEREEGGHGEENAHAKARSELLAGWRGGVRKELQIARRRLQIEIGSRLVVVHYRPLRD